MKIKFKPLGNQVLVEPEPFMEQTESGILIPEMAKERPTKGKVVAVGDGLYSTSGTLVGMNTKVGDEVVFSKYVGTELQLGKKKFIILRESDLFGTLTNET